MPIGVILDLLQESPVLRAIFRSETSHGNEFPDPPVSSVHAGAAVRARRISLAPPSLHLAGFLILHIYPRSSVWIDPVDFCQHTRHREFLVWIELRRERVMRQGG